MNSYFKRCTFVVVLSVVILATNRAHAADISNINISDISDASATIEWTTDVPTDATVNFGLDPRVGTVRDPSTDKKDHSITIDKLDPSTTYYFRVVSTDSSGNKAATAGYSFTTHSTENLPALDQIKDVKEKAVIERIVNDLSKLTSPQAISAVNDKVKQVASDILRPPAIQGDPKVVVESDHADISWTTDREASSMVYFATGGDYNPTAKNPYSLAQGDPSEKTKKHMVHVIGLTQSTTYHFKVSSQDATGLTGESADDVFTTKALLPQVINPAITRIQETSATVTWSTGGVLSKGVVEYTNLRNKVTKSAGNPIYAVNQSVQLTGLDFGTKYSVVITSTNEAGNEVKSNPMTFITVRDVVPPAISKVNNESTLFPSEEVKIQTIISWITDEPAFCQVFYTQGLVLKPGDQGESLPMEANPLTQHTQVIVGFAPAMVYKFWIFCHDASLNESRSEDFVLITPVKEKSIIDVILENFQGTFGWLKNIKG